MKILIADDHPFTLQGTKSFVESLGYQVNFTSSNGIAALSLILLHQPDIAILDINMPGLDGLEIAKKVQDRKLKTKLILMTMHKEMTIYNKATEYGIYGYIIKEHAQIDLEKCLREVIKGNKYIGELLLKELIFDSNINNSYFASLNLCERKIIEFISQNKTSRQIATLLFLSEKTVEGHRTSIINKLNLPKEKNILLKWAIKNSDTI